jgi:hypothetical protein
MAGQATQDEEVRENIDYIDGFELAGNPDREAFVGKLVDHIEHAILPPILRVVLDEVVRPDVIAVFGTQPDAGSDRQLVVNGAPRAPRAARSDRPAYRSQASPPAQATRRSCDGGALKCARSLAARLRGQKVACYASKAS